MSDQIIVEKSKAVFPITLVATFTVLTVAAISFVILRLHIHNPNAFDLSEWLKAAPTVVGGALVAIFAYLGIDRLKDFDDRQDRLTKQLRDELTSSANILKSALLDVLFSNAR